MKINWGTGIAIFIGFFLLSMAFFVYKSSQQKYPLVEEEYYPKGLEYDKQSERIRNAEGLKEKFSVTQSADAMIIKQPADLLNAQAEGSITFYRPSGEEGDVEIPLKVDSTLRQTVAVSRLLEGKYIVKFNWKSSGREFYQEQIVYVKH